MQNKKGFASYLDRNYRIVTNLQAFDYFFLIIIMSPTFIFDNCVPLVTLLSSSPVTLLLAMLLCYLKLVILHVKMGLTDLRNSHCVFVVLIKVFSVLLLQACL